MKNRYKVIRGKSQIFVVAKNIGEAEIIARPLLKTPCATIKIQYAGHA